MLTSVLPKQNFNWLKENSKGPMSNANDSFQRALISGFKENNVQVEILNVPNIGAFPISFKKMKNPGFQLREDGLTGYNFGFTNINLLKHKYIENNLKRYITKIDKEIEYLLVYDLYLPFLEIVKLLKSKKTSLKVILVIPDIYGFTGYSKSFLHKILTNNEEFKIYNNLKYIDGFVLLTEKMLDKLPDYISKDHYTVIEGIVNPDLLLISTDNNLSNQKKIVLYSGAIEERHGIFNLIEAVKSLGDIMELHLYGDGNAKDKVLELSSRYDHIKVHGQHPREYILKKQKEATLLVNPRISEGEFTKYSFPSKIIEYFASETPTLMYKLEGIPDEYYNYCFTPEDETVDSLKLEIINILNTNESLLRDKGLKAKEFVQNHKNSKVQVGKILEHFLKDENNYR